MKPRILAALAAATAAIGLTGCVTDDYGYGSVGLGYGSGYYGWYDDFYYPGTGYYIYDRGGRRHRWSDDQRRYWEARRGTRHGGANWSDYRRGRTQGQQWTPEQREAWRNRHPQHDSHSGDRQDGRDRHRGGNWWRERRD